MKLAHEIKKIKKEEEVTSNVQTKKKKQRIGQVVYGHFCHLSIKFLPLNFLSILERKHFGETGEKIPEPHQFISLPSLQPNTHQKSFSFHFLSKVFHPPYFTSKQTHLKDYIRSFHDKKGDGIIVLQ